MFEKIIDVRAGAVHLSWKHSRRRKPTRLRRLSFALLEPLALTFVAHVILTFLVFRNAETSDKKDWKELILLRRRVGRWVILFEELVDQQSHDPVYFPHHRGQDPGSG